VIHQGSSIHSTFKKIRPQAILHLLTKETIILLFQEKLFSENLLAERMLDWDTESLGYNLKSTIS
jgi:hypothetical protein